MQGNVAIIGGTGVGDRLAVLGGRPIAVPTEDGCLRGRLLELGGSCCVLVQRHSAGHKVPPHRVNYRAMARGLSSLGIETCLATAAVGSLRRDWPAGTLVVPSDVLDATSRNLTLFDRTVSHTDFSVPLPARGNLLDGAKACGLSVEDGGVYICANGPRYETPHEVATYAKVGDLVGMTAATEAILMREAGIAYGLLAVVTNLGCGIDDRPLSHGDVGREMEVSGEKAVAILTATVELLARGG